MGRKPMKLPPVKLLRVRNPNPREENACLMVMSSVLACWASSGHQRATCAAVEQSLRDCMDGPKAPQPPPSNVNYHLARMQKYLTQTKSYKK